MEKRHSMAAAAVLLLGALACANALAAGPAGEVELVRGVVLLQTPGQVPRTAARGTGLQEGDRLSTAESALAMLRLPDGTRMTVRPHTELLIAQYRFAPGAADNSLLMRLVRGGLRTVTGLISKGAPDAARIQTNTATIGIRGTDFDARICASDCAAESAQVAEPSHASSVMASAKVVAVQGEAELADDSPYVHRVIAGSSLYPGTLLTTRAGTTVTLAFRDGTRMSAGPGTRLRLDNFVFDEDNAREGRLLASLLAGEVRVSAGRIAAAQPRNAVLASASGSVQLDDAGVDLRCTGECAGQPQGSGLEVQAWRGAPAVIAQGATERFALQAGQGVIVAQGQVRPATASFALAAPRPDGLDVPAALFAREAVAETAEGLYVQVRDGHVEIAQAGGASLHLGRGETGFSGAPGRLARPLFVPKFIEYDRVPLPVAHRAMTASSLVLAENRGVVAQCR